MQFWIIFQSRFLPSVRCRRRRSETFSFCLGPGLSSGCRRSICLHFRKLFIYLHSTKLLLQQLGAFRDSHAAHRVDIKRKIKRRIYVRPAIRGGAVSVFFRLFSAEFSWEALASFLLTFIKHFVWMYNCCEQTQKKENFWFFFCVAFSICAFGFWWFVEHSVDYSTRTLDSLEISEWNGRHGVGGRTVWLVLSLATSTLPNRRLTLLSCIASHLVDSHTKISKAKVTNEIICFCVIPRSFIEDSYNCWGWTLRNVCVLRFIRIPCIPATTNTTIICFLSRRAKIGFSWKL